MIDLEKEIESIVDKSTVLFDEYLKEHRNEISQIPKLAFLSLYKKTTKNQTRFLGEVYSRNLIKLMSSVIYKGKFSYAIYLDCVENKFVFFDGRDVPRIELLSSYLEHKKSFDIDLIYKSFVLHSQEELHEDVFSITKSERKDKQETAYNYFLHLLEKNQKANFKLTFEDLKIHITGNRILNKFLKSEEDFQKIKNEGIVKSATKLLKQ